MLASMDETGIVEPAYTPIKQYFEDAATFLINRFDDEEEERLDLTSR